jgi:hypothetical protein
MTRTPSVGEAQRLLWVAPILDDGAVDSPKCSDMPRYKNGVRREHGGSAQYLDPAIDASGWGTKILAPNACEVGPSPRHYLT